MKPASTESFESNLQLAENMLHDMTLHLVKVLQYDSTPAKCENSEPPIASVDGFHTSHDVWKKDDINEVNTPYHLFYFRLM